MFIDLKLKNFFGYESKWTPDQVKSYKERERKALVSLEGYLLDGSNILVLRRLVWNSSLALGHHKPSTITGGEVWTTTRF